MTLSSIVARSGAREYRPDTIAKLIADAPKPRWMVRDLLPFSALPPVRRVVPDISLAGFTPPARLGLGVPVWRGVWFPPDNLGTSGIWRPRGAARAINPSIWPPNPPMSSPPPIEES